MTAASPARPRGQSIPGPRPLTPPGQDGIDPSRARESLRRLYEPPGLTPADLSAPLLVLAKNNPAAGALPGAVTLPNVAATVQRWAALGIRGVKIFVQGQDRNEYATAARNDGNAMVRAIQAVKAAAPDLAVTTEVCGCSWTTSHECVLRTDGEAIATQSTYELMAAMAVQHAEAGADAVSPTAMLAGSVRAVRTALDRCGHPDIAVNPNLAILTSLYGPFKSIMDTDPARGDRRGLQLEPGRADRSTPVQARAWLIEGADSLTLQPVMTAIDVLTRLRAEFDVPITAYSTSGEWAALKTLGPDGATEYLSAIKRAGADTILTFAAESVAERLAGRHG
ncbi:hypothetical protein ACWCQL_24290 [Streptomyces sp. NPDC002073]